MMPTTAIASLAETLSRFDYLSPTGITAVIVLAAVFSVGICAFAPKTEAHR